jgi:hypothetical protein
VNRRLAKWLKWGVPVVWETDDSPQEASTATVTQVVHVRYYLPAPAGAADQGQVVQLSQQQDAIYHRREELNS